jgi:four helix bundle suffix protein
MGKAGYEYLWAYKITVPIYDLTVEFVGRFVSNRSRTGEQMIQAARSGSQNVAEGAKEQSLMGYVKLAGVARASLEELLKDYLAFARQKRLEVWPKEKAKREIGEIREIWEIIRKNPYLPDNPYFPHLPYSPVVAVNLMITLVNQANLLLDRLVVSLKEKHRTEGGLTEKLLRQRLDYRRNYA